MAKIFVGLSGGVDSAVSAALLKEQDHEVIGCFIKIWQPEFTECTWREDRLDAMRVAAKLGISFREIDLSKEYKQEVVGTMTADYARGITPNPDVLCNSAIKFGHFFRWALQEGAEGVATGHYARATRAADGVQLLRGKDPNKDQSYFLSHVRRADLERTFFPVGEFHKAEVRQRAMRYSLPNAKKPDSQGLCFVGDVTIEDFLSRYLPLANGPVRSESGALIGQHNGAALYTLGQRHGFRVDDATRPYFVIQIDISQNTLVVSPERISAYRRHARVQKINWIHEADLSHDLEVQARYRERPVRARISHTPRGVDVEFAEPHLISPGQTLAIYRGDQCLGGGVIAP